MSELVFLKLGGSLITDKTRRYTSRLDKLSALAEEITSALSNAPDLRLILGHGSGSFGHYAVTEHLAPHRFPPVSDAGTPDAAAYWQGYSEVWFRASELNRHVMGALHQAGISAISLPPSAVVQTTNGVITKWDLTALNAALESALLPVIYGDIVFDAVRGGSVLSTESLMLYLAHRLRPQRILLAGQEAAVWADFPARHQPIGRITPSNYAGVSRNIGGSQGTDVTGGMRAKVEEMLGLVREIPDLSVQVFSGEQAGNVTKALARAPLGTLIASD
jgi:isopentenyl phosphate kinase